MGSVSRSIFVGAPRERVFHALVTSFGTWFRVALEGPFEVGAVTRGKMTMPGAEGLPFEARTEVIDSPRRFAFTWPQWDFEAGRALDAPWTRVEVVLEAEGDGTRVTVTESGFEKLPAHAGPRILRENTRGWEIQLENLRAYCG